MPRLLFAILCAGFSSLALAAGCGSSGSASGSQGGCPAGQLSCSGCGGSGFCASGQCPAFRCLATDGGGSDSGGPNGPCAAGEAACPDCNGGTMCVTAVCGAVSCPTPLPDASGDVPQVSCFGQICAPGEMCCPGCAPGTGSCGQACTGVGCPPTGDATGPIACGAQTCSDLQVCVYPVAGGVAVCESNDAATCPSGWTPCSAAGSTGTVTGCTPPSPPPYCLNIPAACGGTPTCACLGSNVCNGEMCVGVRNGQVSCLGA
jgi:hypothetical protein